MDRGAWQATVHGVARVRQDLATKERERFSDSSGFRRVKLIEEGSGWGTHVYLWWIHFDIWQN